MKATHKLAAAGLLIAAAMACNNDLVVENLSNPDIARVFASGSSIEATIGAGYQTVHNAMSNQQLQPEVEVLGVEGFSELNNFNMVARVTIPRAPIPNNPGAPTIFNEFTNLSKEARLVVNAMDALDALIKNGGTISTPARNLRARSFGFFVAGTSLGWMSMIYDSAGIVSPKMRPDSIPPLSSAADVAKAAIGLLDSALAIASDPAAASAFPLELAWMSGTAMTLDQYQRLIRSYRARFRAGIARTPAQRAAVDWAKIIDDTENGINANLLVTVGGTSGWNVGFITQRYVDPGWSQMSMMYFGMADVSGGYATYIAAPLSTKNGQFIVQTPDQRWPQGANRAAQQTASVQPTTATSKPYISNRSVSDVAGSGWGISFYDYYRYKYIKNASNTGLFPEFMKAENDLLAAEGYIRTGNIAAAAAKIDLTRVANGGLPALTGVVTSATQAVPGAASCVPQVPQGPAFTTVACGTILEAMKYEKRMETAFSSFGRFWIDSRGWGDLITNTAYEYPVPYQEMQSRQKLSYNLGGGSASSSAKGTYGF